ncbi:MAG: O-antigen ligase family protein [Cyanobacteria bacterium P01_D01_bin.156]
MKSELRINRLIVFEGLMGLGLLCLAIFAWLPDSYFRMVSWPWILVWQGAFLTITTACFWKLRQFKQPFYWLGFGVDWLVLGLLISLAISSLGAQFPLLALQNLLMVVCYGILLYGLHNIRWSVQWLCQGVVWVGAIAAIISLALWQPTPEMWLSENFYEAIRNRFPLGHHNFAGGYFVLVMPVAFGSAWVHKGYWRWVYGGLGAVITAALYASGSRGAWLGGVAVLLLTLVLSIFRRRGKARLSAIAFAGVALCLVLGLLGSNPRVRSLVMDFQSPPAFSGPAILNDGPTVDRVFMAHAVKNVVQHRPLGLGPGNLGRLYENYRPLEAGTGLNQVQQVHNTPLQLVAEMGWLGALWYISLMVCLVRLICYLQTPCSSTLEQKIGLAAAMGLFGYSISSLSDYQLENIPIAVTLTVLVVSLAKLSWADSAELQVSLHIRRWSSLLILMFLALIGQFWLRADLSLLMTHQGLASISQGNLIQSDNKFYTASSLTPWDPTPSALGAQQLTEIALTANDENREILRQEAIQLYQQALQTAPNDIWFNQNLAVLTWQTGDVATAQQAITKVVQLSPRSKNHSYYLLGLTAESLGDMNRAIDAWALECLINPQAFLFTSWYEELADFREAVFARTLQHYQTVLSGLPSAHPLRHDLENHITTLRWWSGQENNLSSERLLLQALFTIEKTPEQAAMLLEQCTTDVPKDSSACDLVNAWLRPEKLDQYLDTSSLDSLEEDVLRVHILEHRTMQSWLRSTTQPVSNSQRVALGLLYRNHYAQKISSILLPDNLRQFSLPSTLKLFTLTWPREFILLDHLVESIRANELGLPHPTRNNFKLTEPQYIEAA